MRRRTARRELGSASQEEAPRQQQIQWGKQITGRDATVDTILGLFETHGHRFSARNLATVAHRVAKIDGRRRNRVRNDDHRMRDLANACSRRVEGFNSQELANTVWAFATADVKAPELFDTVASAALPRLGEFNSQGFANTVWAFATAGVKAPELFDAIAAAALPRLSELNSQHLAIMAWAFACAGCLVSDRIAALSDRVIELFSTFEAIDLSQLYQFWLFMSIEHPDVRQLEPHLQERLRRAYTRTTPRPSRLQRNVSAAMCQLGWTHDFEYVTEEGLSLDMAQPSVKHGVEVDGPSHYLRDVAESGSFVENGATRLKTRLLERLGWTVTRVPFFEWGRLASEAEKRCYLEAKLGLRATGPPARGQS